MLKTIFTCPASILWILILPCTGFANAIRLDDHAAKYSVRYTVHGNSFSTHYLEPLVLEITNTGKENVVVQINNGDLFIPDDSRKQNIVITAPQNISLRAGQTRTLSLKGMCTEPNDGSGDSSTIYTFLAGKNDTLSKLANFIDEHHYQSSAGQYAVWSLVEKERDLNSIYSADSTEENSLKRFVAALSGRTYAVKGKDYRYNYYEPPREKLGGNFQFSFSKPKDVQIALFDKNGILVRELYNQKLVAPGDHNFHFEFDSSVYTDDTYSIKLIFGNEVMIDQEVKVKDIRDAFRKKIEDRN